ncbi:MAG TPA: CoA transferase, partial [Paracoccaceae bacterium]|nr:CoA transferase [Paracoccaceae bacterium]
WIDASQCESGIFLTGVNVLDWSANGRVWQRFGNRSPYKKAAPHGAYRCAGTDRWIAIACFTDEDFQKLAHVADRPGWLSDPRFASLEARVTHQDAIDAAVGEWTAGHDDYDLMFQLQAAGVAAGVCQDAGDRYDRDPQLKHLNWLTEVTGTKIGTWPVNEVPMKLSATPAHAGGTINRGAPNYGEHNEYMLGELLGFSTAQIKQLAEDNVI